MTWPVGAPSPATADETVAEMVSASPGAVGSLVPLPNASPIVVLTWFGVRRWSSVRLALVPTVTDTDTDWWPAALAASVYTPLWMLLNV